jgi:RNA polymerase sigma-70 factor (sigma-E family)
MATVGSDGRDEPVHVVPVPDESSDPAAVLARLYATERPRLIGFARTVLADADGAEEVVQEAFARTLANWERVHDKDDPLPYLRSTILNLCRGRFRRKATPLRPVRDEPSAEAIAGRLAQRAAIVAAMATLPDRQREVVALRYFGELSTDETADALEISPGTVKTHLHRATQALAARLLEHRDD